MMINLRRGSQLISASGVRKKSPIYVRDPVRPPTIIPRGPKPVCDQILNILADGQYHAVAEVLGKFCGEEWVAAVRTLTVSGYAFDLKSGSMKIRQRGFLEKERVFFDLVAELSRLEKLASPPRVPAPPKVEKVVEAVKKSDRPVKPVGSALPGTSDPQLVLSDGKDQLYLPAAESATMTGAILAKKSSGKTYLAMVLAEEFLRQSSIEVPLVIVDPTGVWAPGLRSMADGSPSPYAVLTLGGRHGDLPLSSNQGKRVAEIVDQIRPKSVILDLSNMTPSEQHELVADFGERLFATTRRTPIMLVMDEADEFAPQSLSSSSAHQKRSLEIMDRIVRRGRTKGLGTILVTQRAAVISKNVLSQIDSLFLLCMLAPSDLDAVEDWLHHVVPFEQRVECLGDLPTLLPGEAFFLRGGASSQFRKFKVRRRNTFDSSRTPKSGETVVEPVLVSSPPDVVELAGRILSRPESSVEEQRRE